MNTIIFAVGLLALSGEANALPVTFQTSRMVVPQRYALPVLFES
jgi:hypothetical protein